MRAAKENSIPAVASCYSRRVLALDRKVTFSGPCLDRQEVADGSVEPDSEWQPIPLELPIDDPYRRPPAPAGGERPDPDGDAGRHVIIIDLC
jgi:hypothetical protein